MPIILSFNRRFSAIDFRIYYTGQDLDCQFIKCRKDTIFNSKVSKYIQLGTDVRTVRFFSVNIHFRIVEVRTLDGPPLMTIGLRKMGHCGTDVRTVRSFSVNIHFHIVGAGAFHGLPLIEQKMKMYLIVLFFCLAGISHATT
jgi:hypothetical protein